MACDKTVAETVETLAERLKTSTLLEDRRDACRGLRSLSKDFRVEVCAQAMEPLIQALKNDCQDLEIVNYCLESLNYIISGELANLSAAVAFDSYQTNDTNNGTSNSNNRNIGNYGQQSSSSNPDPGLELAEIFLKKQDNVTIVLEILVETDYKVRSTALKLICGLVRHKLTAVQESILSFPLGVARLVELLSESLEQIRNDAISLFVHLTRNNSNIQKLVVFESAFDKLLAIINTEKFLEGGCVVEDCLIIFLNLLQSNESNQIMFREGSYIQKFMPFFDGIQQIEWDQQKIGNMMLVLQILDTLLMVTNPPNLVQSCQNIMQKCGLLEKLCNILVSNTMPVGVLAETMNMAADIVRGQLGNHELSSNLTMPSMAMTPVLLLSMMKELSQDQERRINELCQYVHSLHDFVSNAHQQQQQQMQLDSRYQNAGHQQNQVQPLDNFPPQQQQLQSQPQKPIKQDGDSFKQQMSYHPSGSSSLQMAPQSSVSNNILFHPQQQSLQHAPMSRQQQQNQQTSNSGNYQPLLDQLDYSDPNIL